MCPEVHDCVSPAFAHVRLIQSRIPADPHQRNAIKVYKALPWKSFYPETVPKNIRQKIPGSLSLIKQKTVALHKRPAAFSST